MARVPQWNGGELEIRPAKKREARLLTKGEQLPYSGCAKALPLAYSGPLSMGKTGDGQVPSLPGIRTGTHTDIVFTRFFLISRLPSVNDSSNRPARRGLLFLKNPIVFGFTVVFCIPLQVGISYISARFILDGDLILGFSLFLLVPLLGILLAFYYLWFRRQRIAKPPK